MESDLGLRKVETNVVPCAVYWFIYRVYFHSHVNRSRLTGGTDGLISADLQHHVREPHGGLAGRVTHTAEIITTGARSGEERGAMLQVQECAYKAHKAMTCYCMLTRC